MRTCENCFYFFNCVKSYLEFESAKRIGVCDLSKIYRQISIICQEYKYDLELHGEDQDSI